MTKSRMHIKKGKSRLKIAIACLVALICSGGLIYSGIQIFQWSDDNRHISEQVEVIHESVEISEVKDNEETKTSQESNEKSLYWKYLETPLLNVNFKELLNQNPDTKGWIHVNNTNINYPFVQSSNNEYYLKHSFDGSYNRAGWVFADFRNKLDGSDKNTILYAHGRNDGTMFGSLSRALYSGWLNNPDNFILRSSTEQVNALWQVFSVYRIPVTNDYIQTNFHDDEEFEAFLKKLKDRSVQDFNTSVSAKDKIITLSTCIGTNERMVLHARLIKWEEKK